MSQDRTAPADTRTMRIVHNALRRDLNRARAVLTTAPYPHTDQRRALAEHLDWMMDFLHHHHSGEDAGLYPMVRRRNPDTIALLDDMDADHHRIEPGMDALRRAAGEYRESADARAAVVAGIDELARVLFPHLEREENEMMPAVAASITTAEWDAWTQEFNVGTRAKSDLAREGLWIMEGQNAEDQQLIAELVPPVPRWIILNIFSRGYRKAAFRRWWSADTSPWKLRVSASSTVTVPATPDQVWSVLADVTRTGEWSHECHTAAWLDGATHSAAGVRFVGSSKVGRYGWTRPCTITVSDAGRVFGYETAGPLAKDSTEWRFVLEPTDEGTKITQSFRILRLPIWYDRLIWLTTPAHRDRRPALRADLERLGALAAEGRPAPAPVK
jgi:hemerythrin-like domain-containing protein